MPRKERRRRQLRDHRSTIVIERPMGIPAWSRRNLKHMRAHDSPRGDFLNCVAPLSFAAELHVSLVDASSSYALLSPNKVEMEKISSGEGRDVVILPARDWVSPPPAGR
jgi:hypothetical protein